MSTAAAPLAPPFAADTAPASPASAVPIPDDCRFCPDCYYDLRAHPPGNPCPECGKASPDGYIEIQVLPIQNVRIAASLVGVIGFTSLLVGAWRVAMVTNLVSGWSGWLVLIVRFLPLGLPARLRIYPWGVAVQDVGRIWRHEHWTPRSSVEIRSFLTRAKLTLKVSNSYFQSTNADVFFTHLPPDRREPILRAIRSFLDQAPSRQSVPGFLARTCQQCQFAIPDLTATHCPACNDDATTNYLEIPMWRPTPLRWTSRISPVMVIGALILATAVLLLPMAFGFPLSSETLRALAVTVTVVCCTAFGALPLFFQMPGADFVWRVAPAGEQRCRRAAPTALKPWSVKRTGELRFVAAGSYRLPRTFFRTNDVVVAPSAAVPAISAAFSRFRDQAIRRDAESRARRA